EKNEAGFFRSVVRFQVARNAFTMFGPARYVSPTTNEFTFKLDPLAGVLRDSSRACTRPADRRRLRYICQKPDGLHSSYSPFFQRVGARCFLPGSRLDEAALILRGRQPLHQVHSSFTQE